MYHCHQKIPEHLFLAKGDQQNVSPALRTMIGVVFIMTQQNISPDLFYVFCKQPD
jgi:hypothetical protein